MAKTGPETDAPKITNHHDNNIRKWIHRFNAKGIEGIISKIHKHKSIKFNRFSRKTDRGNSNQKSTKTLWIAIFYMVIARTGPDL